MVVFPFACGNKKEDIMEIKMEKTYDPKKIEDSWYKKWQQRGYFHADIDKSKKPYTIVIPPPNITGKLHM